MIHLLLLLTPGNCLIAPTPRIPTIAARPHPPSSLAPPLHAAATPLATLTGYGIAAGASGLYLPMIRNLLKDPSSGRDLSLTTWSLKTAASSALMAYPMARGYPLTQYAEHVFLFAQSLALVVLMAKERVARWTRREVLGVGAYGAVMGALMARLLCVRWLPLPMGVLVACQANASALASLALLPQIKSNIATRSGGGWSPVTAVISMMGSLLRVFTTLKLAGGDVLLLAGYLLGGTLNAVILGQVVVWESGGWGRQRV